MARRRRLAASVSAIALGLCGCGTTVSGLRQAQSQLVASGTSSAAQANSGLQPPSVVGPQASAGGQAIRTGSAARRPAGHALGASSAAGGSAPAVGAAQATTPVSGGSVSIGFEVGDAKSTAAAYKAVGGTGEVPDEIGMVKALVNWWNQNGGINGRRVVPVIHQTEIANGSFATQAQAACADFTQDHHVLLAGSTPLDPSDQLLYCLASAHTPLVAQQMWPFDAWYYQHYPGLLYQPGRASPNRWVGTWISVLGQQNYFAAGTKVGLVRYDGPVFTRIDGYIHSAMATAGHRLDKEYVVAPPSSLADFGGVSASLSNAILQFRAAGINRVIFDANGILPYLFMREAESQGYRPAYGFSSNDSPAALLDQGAPAAQLRQSTVVGWLPSNDVNEVHYATPSPAERLCTSIMQRNSIKPISFYSDATCDTVFFLKAVLNRLPSISVSAIPAAVAALGSSYDSPLTGPTTFRRGRYDGASQVHVAKFFDSCDCFKYVGAPIPMG